MRIAHRLVPGLLAGSLVVGGVSAVFAAPAKPHWAALGGQVSNLSGATFTLTLNPKAAAAGKTVKTVQVTLAATAKQRARAGTTGALADGDYAVVVGTRTQTAMTANRVVYSAKAFAVARVAAGIRARHTLSVLAHHRARGTVQSGTATSLVILTRAGKTLTFQLTATTNFRVNGQVSHTAPTFAAGQKVVVVFTVDKATKQDVATGVRLLA
jgi:hypothetical protein